MTPIKGIEIQLDWTDWMIGIVFSVASDFPHLFGIGLGPLHITINKRQYFKNGFLKLTINE